MVLLANSFPINSLCKDPSPSGWLLFRVPWFMFCIREKLLQGIPKCQIWCGSRASAISLSKVWSFSMSCDGSGRPCLNNSTGLSTQNFPRSLKTWVRQPFPAKISLNFHEDNIGCALEGFSGHRTSWLTNNPEPFKRCADIWCIFLLEIRFSGSCPFSPKIFLWTGASGLGSGKSIDPPRGMICRVHFCTHPDQVKTFSTHEWPSHHLPKYSVQLPRRRATFAPSSRTNSWIY